MADGGLRAVLFDFGDTLFCRSAGAGAVVEEARRLGVEVAPERAERLWRQILARAVSPEEMALARDLSAAAHRREWTRLYSMADELAPGMGTALYARETDPARWRAHPDAERVVAEIRAAGLAIGVVSDTGWDIRPVFERAGLRHLIDTFVLSFEHGAVKPAAELFLAACTALEVGPAETLMVGDNPVTDGGAVRAGLPVLLLPAESMARPGGLESVLRLALGRPSENESADSGVPVR